MKTQLTAALRIAYDRYYCNRIAKFKQKMPLYNFTSVYHDLHSILRYPAKRRVFRWLKIINLTPHLHLARLLTKQLPWCCVNLSRMSTWGLVNQHKSYSVTWKAKKLCSWRLGRLRRSVPTSPHRPHGNSVAARLSKFTPHCSDQSRTWANTLSHPRNSLPRLSTARLSHSCGQLWSENLSRHVTGSLCSKNYFLIRFSIVQNQVRHSIDQIYKRLRRLAAKIPHVLKEKMRNSLYVSLSRQHERIHKNVRVFSHKVCGIISSSSKLLRTAKNVSWCELYLLRRRITKIRDKIQKKSDLKSSL